MKQQRFRFKLLGLLLVGLLLWLGLYSVDSLMTYGNRWFATSRNPRVRQQRSAVLAGDILDRNGMLLATTNEDGERIYQDQAEARKAVVHIIGETTGKVANAVETFQTSYLYGFEASFTERAMNLLTGSQRRGDQVVLTIDSRLCIDMAADFNRHAATAGKNGAAVVMNYRTGEVLGLISLPEFDPNAVTGATLNDPGKPFWNRALQSLYPPGSTFKIVTTAAALNHRDTLGNVTDEQYTCTGGLEVDGYVIRDYGSAVHGEVTLRRAFAVSCNNTFAKLAILLGNQKMQQTAEAFGFNDNFLFRDLVVENSAYPTKEQSNRELGASGFGQSAVAATPLHMCMVAAAVANQGVMMEPRLLKQVNAPSGSKRVSFTDRIYRTAMTTEQAALIADYMHGTVTGGTATKAAVTGLTICGKTGTAESTQNGKAINYGWFVGYIDSDELPFAVAVLVEGVSDGEGGGSTAAPIAADIFRYLQAHPQLVTE